MKKTARIRIIILICLWPAIQSYGQADTLKHTKENDYRINAKYRDRTMALSVYAKGSMMNPDYMDFRYGGGVGIEHRLFNYHSLGAGLSLLIADNWPFFDGYNKWDYNLEFYIGYRYYYNLRNRMSKGLTGNNFSANYIFVSPYFWLQYLPNISKKCYWDFNRGIWVIKSTSAIEIYPGLRLGYGLQRTFWRNMNFDINGGIQFREWISVRYPTDLIYLQFSLGYIIK